MKTAHAEMGHSGLFYVVWDTGELVALERPQPEPVVEIQAVDSLFFDFDLETRRARKYVPVAPDVPHLKHNPCPWDEPVRRSYAADPTTTWPSGVYLIRNTGSGRIKIGYATDPDKRLASLQTGSDHELEIIGVIPAGRELERQIHIEYESLRIRGEWFSEEIVSSLSKDYPQWLS